MATLTALIRTHDHAAIAFDDTGHCPLHIAAALGCSGGVQVLLQHGADVNARNRDGADTPLHLAAFAGHLQCVILLLQANADRGAVNSDGLKPCDVATSPVIKRLLSDDVAASAAAAAAANAQAVEEAGEAEIVDLSLADES